jgi:hypothetical protein
MKAMWDERYQSTEYQYGINPNDFFAEQITQIPVGRILIPAAGEGRDAILPQKWVGMCMHLTSVNKAKRKR